MSTRIRTAGGFSRSQVYQNRRGSTCSETGVVFHRNLYTVPQGSSSYMEDTVTPNFRRRQAAGEVFFNWMSRWDEAISCTGNGWAISSAANSCNAPVLKAEFFTEGPALFAVIPTATSDSGSIPVIQFGFDAAGINAIGVEASTGVLNKRGRSDSNLWETLAELDKTVDMLNRPINKLSRLLSAAGNAVSRVGGTRRFLERELADLWLAYRYGIRPLVQDMSNVISALKKTSLSNKFERRTSRNTVQRHVSRFENGFGLDDVTRTDWLLRVDEYVTARAMTLDQIELTISDDLGFTSKGLTTLPWELVSYSFVADWFLNIGDLLGALVPAGPGWKSLGSCLVMDKVVTNTYTAKSTVSTSSAWNLTRGVTGTVAITYHLKWRQGLEAPGLVIKSDFRFDKVQRCIDSLSLLSQQVNRVFGGTRVLR